MKAPLFDDILKISQAIADASSKDKEEEREVHYKALIKLCAAHDNSPRNHPLQWEALGDFTLDADQALDIYQKGLESAKQLSLPTFEASINLSIAQRYMEIGNTAGAQESAEAAQIVAEGISDEELKAEISAFVDSLK